MVEPSHVLLAIGLDEERTHTAIRIGLGRFNIKKEIAVTLEKISHAVKSIEKISAQ